MADLPIAAPGMERPGSGRGIIRRVVCLCFLFTVILLPSTGYSAPSFSRPTAIPPPFWAAEIDTSLQERDRQFREVFLANDSFPVIELEREKRAECLGRLQTLPDSESVWYNLFSGLLRSDVAGAATGAFERCLDSASNRPGDLWVLSVEFTRNSQTSWSDRSLLRLEQLLLEAGATAAPVIAQQFMHFGMDAEKGHNFDDADRCFAWAQRFDPDQPWSLIHRARLRLPAHPAAAIPYVKAAVRIAGRSWNLQLSLADHAYAWFRLIIMAWVLITVAGLSLRHLPKAVHPLADSLPDTLPLSVRTGLIIALVIAASAFGMLPFLWLLAFLALPFLEKRERTLMVIAIALLAMSPLDSRIRESLRRSSLPGGSTQLYLRACEEGCSSGLRNRAAEKQAADAGDALAALALSQCLVKAGDISGAHLAVMSAQSLIADDPEALSSAGMAAFAAADYTTAAAYYRKIIDIRPASVAARYNFARCAASEADSAMSLAFMQSLSAGDRDDVRAFIALNDACFGSQWPPLRQLMPEHCIDLYFWTPGFRHATGGWKEAKELWGASFFGLAPLPSLYLFLLIIAAMIFRQLPRQRSARRRLGACALCNRPICDRCRRGRLCHGCFHATSPDSAESAEPHAEEIKYHHRRRTVMIGRLLDIALPGSGMLFAPVYRWPLIVLVGVVTAVIYGSGFFAATVSLSYPMGVVMGEPEKLLYMVPGYNLLFVGRMVAAVVWKRGTPVV